MSSPENSNSEKDATIADLKKQIENLKKLPGDTTDDVYPDVEDNNLKVASESKKLFDNVKDI